MKTPFLIFFSSFLLLCSCNFLKKEAKNPEKISDQWHQGKAEISSFEIQQARYGEIRKGQAVMIFVTEDFSEKKQVKLDAPEQYPNDVVKILKLNFTKNFTTGIYPYSVMNSVFTPTHFKHLPASLKITNSMQEWCGHTFTQLNKQGKKYKLIQHSYFENEGETYTQITPALLEDELWNLIRIDPTQIPTGKQKMLPALMYLRFTHLPIIPQTAEIKITQNDTLNTLSVYYPSLKRMLEIYFGTKENLYTINGWKEIYTDGKGEKARTLVSSGKKTQTLWYPYWNLNSNRDSLFRKKLQLE
ncbi:MAG: hypothetical protein HJHJAOHD_00172 [Flavobacteriales bacterium]|nr:hypothetical protein [Flavobacteriales bacterium]MCL4816423.1 septum formation inhibitor Maf [Flavobacteriales bacterium]